MSNLINFPREHHAENNADSQRNYDQNKVRFANQSKIVYEALLRGERLTSLKAMFYYNIMHLPRRIKTLKDEHKINIKERWVKQGNTRFKEWFV